MSLAGPPRPPVFSAPIDAPMVLTADELIDCEGPEIQPAKRLSRSEPSDNASPTGVWRPPRRPSAPDTIRLVLDAVEVEHSARKPPVEAEPWNLARSEPSGVRPLGQSTPGWQMPAQASPALRPIAAPWGSRQRSLEATDVWGDLTPTPAPLPSIHESTSSGVAEPTRKGRWGRWLRSGGWRRNWTVAATAILLMACGAAALYLFQRRHSEKMLRAAVDRALADGDYGSLNDALRLQRAQSPESGAALSRLAFLEALAVTEHGIGAERSVGQLLARLQPEDRWLEAARMALAYRNLAEGDVEAARQSMPMDGASTGSIEYARLRSLLSVADGDLQSAVREAQSIVDQQPNAARHVVLLALLSAQSGDSQRGLDLLRRLPNAASFPAVLVARGRIMSRLVDQREEMQKAARAILAQRHQASGRELAWAHVLLAQYALDTASQRQAKSEALAASALRAQLDEELILELVPLLVRTDAVGAARTLMQALPRRSFRVMRRAQVEALMALGEGDHDAAENWLLQAGDSGSADLLRADVAVARNQPAMAQRLYERAALDPTTVVMAQLRLSELFARLGKPRDASSAMLQAWKRGPRDAGITARLCAAQVAAGEMEAAERLLATVANRWPQQVDLHLCAARLAMRRGRLVEAVPQLRTLAEQHGQNVEVLAAYAEAARLVGATDEAQRGFERALTVQPLHAESMRGLLLLAIAQNDMERAQGLLERLDQKKVAADPSLTEARARLLLLEGAGKEAVEALTPIAESMQRPELWSALGQAYLQADLESSAKQAFRRALSLDAGHAAAHLGLAWLAMRAGQLSSANQSINAAEAARVGEGLPSSWRSRLLAARGALRFEYGDLSAAEQAAHKAIATYAKASEARWVLANIAAEKHHSAVDEWRRAIVGNAPVTEALARLSLQLGPTTEGCEMARRYLRAAPKGYDASAVQQVIDRCPRESASETIAALPEDLSR